MAKKTHPALNAQLLEIVREPIYRTWQAIGCDAEPLCEGDNECAIEICIDADQLTSFCRSDKDKEQAQAADKAIGAAIDQTDYLKVLKFLGKNIQLV